MSRRFDPDAHQQHIDAYIRRVVDAAPPLSAAQVARLRMLFASTLDADQVAHRDSSDALRPAASVRERDRATAAA